MPAVTDHRKLPRVCTPEEFLAASPIERLLLLLKQIDLVEPLDGWDQTNWAVIDDGDEELYGTEEEADAAFDRFKAEMAKTPDTRDVCGTAFCAAGWTAILAGDQLTNDSNVNFDRGDGTRVVRQVSERSDYLLGIGGTGHGMYEGSNTRDDLDWWVGYLAYEIGEELPMALRNSDKAAEGYREARGYSE